MRPVDRVALGLFAVLGAGFAPPPLLADTRLKSLGKVQQGPCPLALDSLGSSHVAFQSPNYHLHHAWLDGRRWRKELVDGASDCGWGSSIAVSQAGDIHISYHAERRDPVRGRLVHARFSGGTWQRTDLDTSGRSTHLALDAAGQPHILHENDMGRLGYARFDGAAWSIEDTGLGSSPYTTGLVLDAGGHAHVSYAINYQGYFHATNATGGWVSTQLGTASAPTGITLDSQGRPVLAAAQGGVLRVHRQDGAEWRVEELPEFGPQLGVAIDSLALALDGNDRAHLLVSAFLMVGESSAQIALHAYEVRNRWGLALIDLRDAGYHTSLALDASGIVHGTFLRGARAGTARLTHVRIAEPDLLVAWENASAAEVKGGVRITGRLHVRNQGPGAAGKATIALVLSDDDVLDETDTTLPRVLRVRKLKPAQSASVKVSLRQSLPVSGKRLIAILAPNVRDGEPSLENNTAVTLIAP